MPPPVSKPTAAGIGILGILVLIAGWIVHQQFSFNPAVKVLLQTGTGPAMGEGSPATPAQGALIRLTEPLVPLSGAEHFDAVTLSDKIDGKAELYLPSGFKSMDCQRFKAKDSDIWLEVFIYDMSMPENAFSVFSRQKRDRIQPLDLARYAYQTENAIFLAHGRFYIEMIASAPSSTATGWMAELARAFISDHPELAPGKLDVPDLFPLENLDKESITLVTTDAFGFDRLDQVYTAGYNVSGVPVSAFISKRGSRQEAEKLAAAYGDFLKAFGGQAIGGVKLEQAEQAGAILQAVEIMDTVELVFSVGPFVAGVREAEDLKSAQTLASAVLAALLKKGAESP